MSQPGSDDKPFNLVIILALAVSDMQERKKKIIKNEKEKNENSLKKCLNK